MNLTILSIVKRSLASNAKRYFHCNSPAFQQKKDDGGKMSNLEEKGNPFCLEYIDTTSHTLRYHDNCRRQRLYEYGIYVAACLPKYVQKVQIQHTDELEVLCHPDGIFPVLSFLCHHQHSCFNACSLVTAIDVPSREYRFEVIYCLQSLRFCERIRVKTYADELTPVHSAYSLWSGVNWYEREVYDMFGIIFTHHPDLRRILTDYGFPSHPLRKDFPLIGYTECRYDDELKKVVYEPIEFSQEFRRYEIGSPWTYYNNFHKGFNAPKPPPSPPPPAESKK